MNQHIIRNGNPRGLLFLSFFSAGAVPSPMAKTHLLNTERSSHCFSCKAGFKSLMFVCNVKSTTCYHSIEFVIDVPTTSHREPLRTTAMIFMKSPPRTTDLPQNGSKALVGICSERISLIVLSNASKQRRCVTGASSHMMRAGAYIS